MIPKVADTSDREEAAMVMVRVLECVRSLFVTGVVALGAVACAPEPRVRLDVLLQTDYRPGVDFAEVRVELLDELTSTRAVSEEESFLSPSDVMRLEGLAPSQLRRLRLELVRSDGTLLEPRSRTVSFSHRLDHQPRIPICAACADFACPFGQTCECGRVPNCVPEECQGEGCTPDEPCVTDADCPASGLECVDAVCRGGACLRAPNDGACEAPRFCQVGSGSCVPRSAYARAVLEDAPVAYWRLDDPVGSTTARDETSNGWDLTVEGVVVFGWPGALAGEPDTAAFVDIDGAGTPDSGLTDASVPFPEVAEAGGPFTYEAWVRWNGPRGDWRHVVAGRESTDGEGGLGLGGALYFVQDRLWLRRLVSEPTGSSRSLESFVNVPTEASWQGRFIHLVATFDGEAERLYVDGLEMPMASGASRTNEFRLAAVPFVVGRSFNGRLDEVAVYDYALSAERIAHHHALGVGASE